MNDQYSSPLATSKNPRTSVSVTSRIPPALNTLAIELGGAQRNRLGASGGGAGNSTSEPIAAIGIVAHALPGGPWTAADAHGAGTVHLGVDMNGLTSYAAALARREIPQQPLLLLGQMTTADSSRLPAGTESAWAYTHLPEGLPLSADDVRRHTDLLESVVERNAPGFRDTILARSVQAPLDLQSVDANLHGGAINGGTAGIHQQLIFRPLPGLGRAETPIDGLYLASASAQSGRRGPRRAGFQRRPGRAEPSPFPRHRPPPHPGRYVSPRLHLKQPLRFSTS